MSFRQHLQELRLRLLISVLALLAGAAVAFGFFRPILELLVRPASLAENNAQLVFIEATEMLGVSIKVSMMAGLVLALPVVLYQVVRFVAPGLTPREKRYLLAFLPGAMLAFMGGVAFGYFVLLPPALGFLLTFGADVATPMIRVSSLVGLVLRLLFWMGVVFETPLVMYLLAQLGITTAQKMARFRRYWLILAFMLGAIITPTFDPLNQALVAGPLLVLYELGIWLARLAGWNRRRSREAATGAANP
jgi:sec-independent protein translocase protein TatC